MIDVVVVAKRKEADNIYSYFLSRPEGGDLPGFTAGAHIDVHLPPGFVRQYSLCSSPDNLHEYEIAVLKESVSRGGSTLMHDEVGTGTRLKISEPKNHFPLHLYAKRHLLFAGGIGITPLLAMAEVLSQKNADFQLHYSARTRSAAAFVERIQTSAFANNTQFYFSEDGPARKLQTSDLLSSPDDHTHIYICGPARYMESILSLAKESGWPDTNVHREYFSVETNSSGEDTAFEIEIKSSGQIIQVEANQSVIDALEAQGIFVPVSCEEGVCGTCLTRVLAGEPDHRDVFMTDEEHAANDQFTPCCSRSLGKRLVLDL